MQRATDLMPPPMSLDSLITFKIEDLDLEWLIADLEGGMRTCCVKAFNQERLSRSSILVYRGQVVGCMYANKFNPDRQPTAECLPLMIEDLKDSSTEVEMYDLPEYVVLSMSSLFLGYPVQRNDNYDARSYMDYICGWFESKKTTACLAITLRWTSSTCLAYIYNGHFCGAFHVEKQKFTTDKEFVYELFRNDHSAQIEAAILPPGKPLSVSWNLGKSS